MESIEAHETARKTFFWYRVYCVVVAFLSLAVAALGVFLIFVPVEPGLEQPEQFRLIGAMYAAFGIASFVIFAVAALLPPKPYNWVVGIVMLALGMSSCCLWPAVIPLLIYWVKPETQAFLGRTKNL